MKSLDRIRIVPYHGQAQVMFNDEVIADSKSVLCLYENRCEPVLYFPANDVHMKWLEQVSHTSFCEFKGHASY